MSYNIEGPIDPPEGIECDGCEAECLRWCSDHEKKDLEDGYDD